MSDEPEDEVWISASGARFLVGEMTEAHVRNVLRLLLRRKRQAAQVAEASEQSLDHAYNVAMGDKMYGSGWPP